MQIRIVVKLIKGGCIDSEYTIDCKGSKKYVDIFTNTIREILDEYNFEFTDASNDTNEEVELYEYVPNNSDNRLFSSWCLS